MAAMAAAGTLLILAAVALGLWVLYGLAGDAEPDGTHRAGLRRLRRKSAAHKKRHSED